MPPDPSTFVLLDLDGTLVHLAWGDDALGPLRQRVRAIIAELGLDPPFGQMVPALAEAGRGRPHVAAALAALEEAAARRATACPGLPAFMAALRGRPSALVTNNGQAAVQAALAAAGLSPGAFGAVVSREAVARYKPDPEPLRRAVAALAAHGGPPAEVLMIGDAATDVLAARALAAELPCGVRTLAVLGGVSSEADLRAAGADVVAGSLDEIALLL